MHFTSFLGYILISIPLLFTRRHRSLNVRNAGEGSRTSVTDNAIAERTESALFYSHFSKFPPQLFPFFRSLHLQPSSSIISCRRGWPSHVRI